MRVTRWGEQKMGYKRGSELPHSKLCEEDVRLIRQLINERDDLRKKANELSDEVLADKFDVSPSTIRKVKWREVWNHVR